ncbi:MAG: ABC transporter permease [Pedobacter sp.]|nr:ABC transporter permease [Chitinophagaceae bacterium]
MNFLFAWRYFKSKKTTNAINIIAWISVTAIAVVTASLIVVFSVFNGFEDLVKSLYADFYADVRVSATKGKIIHLSTQQIIQLKKLESVAAVSLVVEEKALLMNGDDQSIVVVKGIDESNISVNNISNHIIRGKFNTGTAGSPRLVLGSGIESAIRANVESSLTPLVLNLPNKKATKISAEGGFNSYSLYASGTFAVQQEFDDKYVFTNLSFLKYMLDMGTDDYSAVEIKLTPNTNTDNTLEALQTLLGKDFIVETRYQQNKSLYSAMQVEKWIIYGITCLILTIAAFNIIGALTMLVLEKQKDIAVLKAMGATNNLIKNIFLSEGFLLAIIGGLGGAILATIICLLQQQFHLVPLGGSSFLINYYPVKLLLSDYLIVIGTVFVIAILAAYIPSRKASLQSISLKS